MPRSDSPALGLARFLLVFLLVLNLVTALALVVALPATFVFEPTFTAFFGGKRPPRIDAGWLLPLLRVWMVLAVPVLVAVHVSLRRMLAMVATVRDGDPFVPDNAARLAVIAWCTLAGQVFHLVNGAMSAAMNAAGSNIEWSFSLTGWLAVVLLFVLARVFEEGTRLRGDLETMI